MEMRAFSETWARERYAKGHQTKENGGGGVSVSWWISSWRVPDGIYEQYVTLRLPSLRPTAVPPYPK